MCVLDAPSDESIEQSNVIPVLPVQSRDLAKTGRTSRRRRRETVAGGGRSQRERSRGLRSSGENAVMRDDDDEQHTDAAAAILVSSYVTGSTSVFCTYYFIYIKPSTKHVRGQRSRSNIHSRKNRKIPLLCTAKR